MHLRNILERSFSYSCQRRTLLRKIGVLNCGNAVNNAEKVVRALSSSSNDSRISLVDLRSDTVTTPTPAMYEAMITSPIGDDVFEEDPTVKTLETKCARLFGKEAALFVPSGSMGNLISVMAHCQSRFEEAIVGDASHILLYEVGGVAHFGGVQLRSITNKADGTFDLHKASKLIRVKDVHNPRTKLICLENTHNKCGGKVLPLSFLKEVQEFSNEHRLKCHMDGARLLNAVSYLNVPPKEILQYVDSVNVCFSKGLCAPVGSIIAGTKDFISRSRWIRKALGGGMRQVGVLAGPALVGLETIYPKLHEDHQKTKEIAMVIKDHGGSIAEVDLDGVHTNILMISLKKTNFDAQMFADRMAEVTEEELRLSGESVSVLFLPFESHLARMVLHHNINQNDVEKTITKLKYVLKELNNTVVD